MNAAANCSAELVNVGLILFCFVFKSHGTLVLLHLMENFDSLLFFEADGMHA